MKIKKWIQFVNESTQEASIVLKNKEDVIKFLEPLKGTILMLKGLTEDGKLEGTSAKATVKDITMEYNPSNSSTEQGYVEFSCKIKFDVSEESSKTSETFTSVLYEFKKEGGVHFSYKGGGQYLPRIIMDASSSFLSSYEVGATKDSTFFTKLAELFKQEIPWYEKGNNLNALGAGK